MKCIECKKIELNGRQKMYCSNACKLKHLYHKADKGERLKKLKTWRDKNKEKISENKARYYQKHRERLLEVRKQYHKEHPEVDKAYKQRPKGRYMTYRLGAKNRNLLFEITLEEFTEFQYKPCVYCGDTFDKIGIDRVNSSKGYVKGNMVSCCEMCNKMKLHHDKETFINHCKQIAKNN